MLNFADIDLTNVIEALASKGVEAGYLVPTVTGLNKSIMDAHQSLRSYLKSLNYHDFDKQAQGPEGKVVKECSVLSERGWLKSKVSLYRPNTKAGDPRIWVSGLSKHASPGNLLVVLVVDGHLHLANASRGVWATLKDSSSPLAKKILQASKTKSPAEEELLGLLGDICRRGFITSTTNADSGVGDTLERLLGIKRNASRAPDYKGVELKASRKVNSGAAMRNRSNLFSLVPDWASSNCKNGREILDKYGYIASTGKRALQVTVNNKPNAQGLYLTMSPSEFEIENMARVADRDDKVVLWQLGALQNALAEKHRATFWVRAETRSNGPIEEFHYQSVTITARPLVQNFGPLVLAGKIEMEYTFSEKERPSGKSYVRDHGYLWKIKPSNLHLIFPSPYEVDLSI